MRKMKKIVSMLSVVIMILVLCPASVIAEEMPVDEAGILKQDNENNLILTDNGETNYVASENEIEELVTDSQKMDEEMDEEEDEDEREEEYVVEPWIHGKEEDEETGTVTWPKGVSYDEVTNTLTLKDTNIDCEDYYCCISYSGKKALTIELLGKNIFKWVGEDAGHGTAILSDYWSQGDIHIIGDGSLELINGGAIWTQSYNSDAGDLYVDGVTLISDGEGLVSQYSNMSIKNATIDINNRRNKDDGVFSGRTFGVCTGRVDGNGDDIEEWGKYGGLLTVENSDIVIRNCTFPIAANEIKLIGCKLYGGKNDLEYEMNPAHFYLYNDYGEEGSVRRYHYENEYMKISSQNLNLPEAYFLNVVYDANDKNSSRIWLPDYAGAGQKVDVEVSLEKGYRLKNLYVNGKEISGTEFIMPAEDTTVKALFEKTEEDSEKGSILISKISISGTSKKIAAGKKVKLSASVLPADAENKKVEWKSSNKKVATVNQSGVVTMKKNSGGKSVTITATAMDGSKKSASWKLTSMKGIVKKIAISGKKTVKAGKSLKLKAKVTASKKANTKLKWSSSNKKYATVNSKGKVNTYKAGKGKKVKITAASTDGSEKKNSITIKLK